MKTESTENLQELLTKRDEAVLMFTADWQFDLPKMIDECDLIQSISDESEDPDEVAAQCFTRA